MLTIREAQLRKMGATLQASFEQRLARHLEEKLGIATERVHTELPDALNTARRFGITREGDVATFCELMYRHIGVPSLDGFPKEAQNILLAYGEDPEEKLRKLELWALHRGPTEEARA